MNAPVGKGRRTLPIPRNYASVTPFSRLFISMKSRTLLLVALPVAALLVGACFVLPHREAHSPTAVCAETRPVTPHELLGAVAFVVIGYEGNLPLMQAGTVPPPENGTGLAVPVDADGYYLCAAHSVDPTRDLFLMGNFGGRRQALLARVVFRGDPADVATDYALLKVEAKVPAVPAIAPTCPESGGKVRAAVRRDGAIILEKGQCKAGAASENGSLPGWLQTDLTLIPGDSGGPLFNEHWELLGLSSRGMAFLGMHRTIHCCPPWEEIRGQIARDRAGKRN
jgi:S1-C subfamily serine protease